MIRPILALHCLVLAGTVALAGGEAAESPNDHWAYRPISHPAAPPVKRQDLVNNPIDSFLLNRLEASGLAFAPAASKLELIRRVKFDLLGLPPTPEEVAEFLSDEAGDAYERLVDRYLASPHYGEHWGRYWLDVVRYAETAGFNADPLRPLSWKYRDYVIRAFNRDTPFDRFILEQIAGDELFPDDAEAQIATGYVLMWPDESNASNVLLARQESLNDLTANVGSVFLASSIGCAQCHDHKFDPLSQVDFFRLQAFFSGIVRNDKAPVGTAAQLAEYREQLARWETDTESLRSELHELETPARVKAAGERRMKFPAIVLDSIDTAPEKRTTMQRQLAFWSERQMEIREDVVSSHLNDAQKKRRAELKAALNEWEGRKPRPPVEAAGMVVGELNAVPPATFRLAGGSYDKPREEVTPGFPVVMMHGADAAATVQPPTAFTSGRRTALARWLVSPANPLTARVIVNRLWQGHFGRGLVDNANDFGNQTSPPSHPELLDWLAWNFSQSIPATDAALEQKSEKATASEYRLGWSFKRLHRLLLTSRAYRQSTDRGLATENERRARDVDPGNRLYWHSNRRRLNAEGVRDSFLFVSGTLDSTVHGPSVFPELPPDFNKREAWKVSTVMAEKSRRSIYIHAKRNLPYPLLEAFDLPDMHESCARRAQTTVAPQALMLLNSDLVLGFAQSFAGNLLIDNPHGDLPRLIERAYESAYGRKPTNEELGAAQDFIQRQQSLIALESAPGRPVLLPRRFPKFLDPYLAAAVVDFCHALLNSNEFVYVD